MERKIGLRKISLAMTLCMASPAFAFDAIEFGSPYDHFTLKKVGSRYQLKDQNVDLGTFKDFLPLFAQNFVGNCDRVSKLKPDLTVKLISSTPPAPAAPTAEGASVAPAAPSTPVRHFYIRERISSDGKACASISGEGIFYLPLHSSWFEKNKAASISLGKAFTLERKGKPFVKVKQTTDGWIDDADDQYLNWEFLEAFMKSLEAFAVDLRLHPAAGDKKPSFTLVTPTEKYTFYRVGTHLWGAQGAKSGWLLSSKSWSFWQAMDENIWANPFSDQLKVVFDRERPLDERERTLKSLENIWNISIKRSFHRLILDSTQEQKLRDITLNILKKKPSLENISVFMQCLQQTDNPEFQSDLTKALRVRNPKGPIIQPEDSPEKRAEAVKSWTQWWKQIEMAR